MNLMILAAGPGSRLQPLTLSQHKACVPILNVPVVCFGLHLFRTFSFQRIVANVCYFHEQVKHTLGEYAPLPVTFSDERKQILGSGGALVKARALLANETKNFFTLNADTLFLPEEDLLMEKMKERHIQSQSLATLLCIPGSKVDKSFSKVWTLKEPCIQVSSVGLEPPEKGLYRDWHFTGIALFSERIFQYLPSTGLSYFFQDGLLPAIRQGEKVEIYESSGLWLEMGRPGDLLLSTYHLMDILQQGKEPYQTYLRKLLQTFGSGLTLKISKESILIYPKSCFISEKAHLKGKVVLGENNFIGEGVYLENVILQDNCKLDAGCRLKNSLMGKNQEINGIGVL